MWFVRRKSHEALSALLKDAREELGLSTHNLQRMTADYDACNRECANLRRTLIDERNSNAELRGRLVADAHARGESAPSMGKH